MSLPPINILPSSVEGKIKVSCPGQNSITILSIPLGNITNFFNVSTDYLLGNSNIKDQKQFDEDLEKSLDTFKSFDGKPMYDEDREKIREFLRKRMEDRLKDN